MIHSFLLIGQSNAAGRGYMNDCEPLDNLDGKIKVLRNGLWVKMYRPVNPDRPFSGVCLAESFAKEYALARADVQVGIIPCADGGTKICQWMPGEILFDNAVNCARLAMRTSSLKGILWHQGESDCTEDGVVQYKEKFITMMNAMRETLGCPDLPVVIGGLGDYLKDFNPRPDIPIFPKHEITFRYPKMNERLEWLGANYHNCAFAPATGLTANADNLHFSAASLLELGVRYYRAYESIVPTRCDNSFESVPINTDRTALEML